MKQVKFQMMMDEELSIRLNDWRFANRVETKAEAIRLLIEKGLEASAAAGASDAPAGQTA